MISWRTAAIVLALVCVVQRWQTCTRTAAHATTSAEPAHTNPPLRDALAHAFDNPSSASAGPAPALPRRSFFGFHPPAWAARLLPQPGETMRAYRERIVPLAEIAIAPQRARVARLHDALDEHERSELDAAAAETATAIEARIATALANGELDPSAVKPMTGVALARDVLDLVDRGNARFIGALTPEQRAALTFDFADYLVFSTRWEDALPR